MPCMHGEYAPAAYFPGKILWDIFVTSCDAITPVYRKYYNNSALYRNNVNTSFINLQQTTECALVSHCSRLTFSVPNISAFESRSWKNFPFLTGSQCKKDCRPLHYNISVFIIVYSSLPTKIAQYTLNLKPDIYYFCASVTMTDM